MNVDFDIVLWINGHYSAWADEIMWLISQARTWIPLYVLIVVFLAYKYRNWKAVLLILLGFGIAVGLSDFTCSGILKPLVCRLRPTHEPGIDPLHLVHGYIGGRFGFCSSHAANTMAVMVLFGLLYKRVYATSFLAVWVALNCYSRMYLGAHYPSDIIVGLLVGCLWALLVYWVLKLVLRVVGVALPQGGS